MIPANAYLDGIERTPQQDAIQLEKELARYFNDIYSIRKWLAT